MTGKQLNTKFKIGALHALYREDGKWYHHLTRFPGVYFDNCDGRIGMIKFETENDFKNCKNLNIGETVNIRDGIQQIIGYKKLE